MSILLLWDIDGTLIDSGGAGERALRLALERGFGRTDDLKGLEYFGRTDVWIARAILTRHGFSTEIDNINLFLAKYLEAVAEQMANPHARLLPGISAIVTQVARQSGGLAQGLLTGNLRRGAEIKLGHFDLWRHFPFGAFADDAEHRDELGPHALRRAFDHHRVSYAPDRVYVVGDTPHDIACARAIGARVVAVATGKYTMETLAKLQPDALFPDFADVEAFFRALR